MKITCTLIVAYIISLTSGSIFAQTDSLRKRIGQIIRAENGNIGVAIQNLENGDTITFNGNKHYPMQSVYKFHVAMAVLNQVDEGKLTLNQNIHIKKEDLLPDTWSPLREKYPEGGVDIPLSQILQYTVSQSDNNGCDILFRLLGGTKNVEQYIHDLGVKNVAIAATEEEMHKVWDVQFTNWTTPRSMMELLEKFYQRKYLSKSNSDFLWQTMAETTTGPNRIKGLLPAGTVVAHKTGSSDTNEQGVTAATNDVGIIKLPNGQHFAIAVFVSNSTAIDKERDRVIAEISKAAWDYFSTKR